MGQSKKLFCRLISLSANSLKGLNQVQRLSSDSDSESSPVQSSSSTLNSMQQSSSSTSAATAMTSFINEFLDQQQKQKQSGKVVASLQESLHFLDSKISEENVRICIDREYFLEDSMSFYKSVRFDPSKRLKVQLSNEPAIDIGGVTRQFFSDLFESFENGGDGFPPL